MRKFSAEYIYTGKEILRKGIVETDDYGKILTVIDTGGKLEEKQSLEFHNGVIVPGFVNAHCHLELSHMKGVIDNKVISGLPAFIDEIISKRNFPEDLEAKISKADKEMRSKGIVALGDISNTDDSFSVKQKSSIYYQTFVEAFTISEEKAEETSSALTPE